MALYQDALALNPGRADIRLKLGNMLKELARFGEAEAAYRQAAALAPQDRAVHRQLGDLLTLMGRTAEAAAAYAAEAVAPEAAPAWQPATSESHIRAVVASDTPLLVFANDDMVMLSDGWDRRLRGLLDRPEIGAVGARLVYPDDSVQHAGILLGWTGLAVHDGRYEPLAQPGPCRRWHVTRAVGAVTGAFLAIRREVFAAVGGFDEIALPVGYSDIDLALKLRARGLKVLWTPHITLRHFESKTRGLDHLDPEKRAHNESEQRLMTDRGDMAMEAEPSLNPTWHRATLPFRLLSAPSQDRLWHHIRLCAAPNPWLPDAAGGGIEPPRPSSPAAMLSRARRHHSGSRRFRSAPSPPGCAARRHRLPAP